MPASALRHSDPQHQTLRAERDRHQKHYKALAAERDHYRQSLSEERSKSNALQAKIIALENENNGLKCKINDLQYELESLSLQPAASRPTSPAPSASASKTGPLAKGKEKAAIAETQDGDLSEPSSLFSVSSSESTTRKSRTKRRIMRLSESNGSDSDSDYIVPASPPNPRSSMIPDSTPPMNRNRKTYGSRISSLLQVSPVRPSNTSVSGTPPTTSTSVFTRLKRKHVESSSDSDIPYEKHKQVTAFGNSFALGYSPDLSVNERVMILWRQFLRDIIRTVPRSRGGRPSYLKLTKAKLENISEEIYMNRKLSDIWTCCRYKVVLPTDLEATFDHLFPASGLDTSLKDHGYRRCLYFGLWMQIHNAESSNTFNTLRMRLKQKVCNLLWIPHAQDKLWNTSQSRTAGYDRLPRGYDGPAPRILITTQPEW